VWYVVQRTTCNDWDDDDEKEAVAEEKEEDEQETDLDQVLAKLFRKRFDQDGSGTCWQLQAGFAIGMSKSKLSSPSIDLGRATTDIFRGAACML
jgi:hypothetical protein